MPYAGNEETEDGMRTKFLKGSHREIQVLRRKFAGDTWNMMIGVSGLNHEGKYGAEFSYPEIAVDTDGSTWGEFSFSKSKSVKDCTYSTDFFTKYWPRKRRENYSNADSLRMKDYKSLNPGAPKRAG